MLAPFQTLQNGLRYLAAYGQQVILHGLVLYCAGFWCNSR